MSNDKELVELVKQAFEESKTRYIKEEELLGWLKKSGLGSEKAARAIHIAMSQDVVRFCYPSSVGGKELVPCYERITEEDLLPPEIVEEMRKKIVQKYRKAKKARKKGSEQAHYRLTKK